MRYSSPWPKIAAGCAVVVASPAIAASPELDERFQPYEFTAQFGANPLRLIHFAFSSIPDFLAEGNFRPGGRIVEWSGHDLAGQAIRIGHLPLNLSLGLLRLAAAAILAFTIVWLVQRLLKQPNEHTDPALLATISLFVGASFLVSSIGGPVNLFPWLYLGTGALTLAATAVFTSADLYEPDRQMSRRRTVAMVLLGIALAGTNEVTAIAIPLSAVVILVRGLVLDIPLATLIRLPVARAYLAQLLGFVALFIPVRLLIAAECSDGSCYSDSDFVLSGAYPNTVVGRMATSFLPPQWRAGSNDPALDAIRDGDLGVVTALFVLLFIPVVVAGWRALAASDTATKNSSAASHRDLIAVAAFGVGLVVVTTALFSTSRSLQEPSLRVGEPWRDSALATPGAALITAAAVVWLSRLVSSRTRVATRPVIALVATVAVYLSFVTTWSVGVEAQQDRERILNNRIALEVATFEATSEANEQRCELLDEWGQAYHDVDSPNRPAEVSAALDEFIVYAHGADGFCVRADDSGQVDE